MKLSALQSVGSAAFKEILGDFRGISRCFKSSLLLNLIEIWILEGFKRGLLWASGGFMEYRELSEGLQSYGREYQRVYGDFKGFR